MELRERSVEHDAVQPVFYSREKRALSASALNLFYSAFGCAREYVYRYIERIETPSNINMAFGSAVDHAFSTNLRQKVETQDDLPADEVVDLFVDELDRLHDPDRLKRWERPIETTDGDPSPDRIKDEGAALIRLYMKREMPWLMPSSVSDIQHKFRLVVENYPFDVYGVADYSGFVLDDGMDRIRGRVLRDWKVVSRSIGQDRLDGDLQLTVYLLAFRQEFGEDPVELAFDQLVRPSEQWPEPNVLQDGSLSKRQPREPSLELALVERTDADIEWFWRLYVDAVRAIESGVFVPVGPTHWKCAPGKCSYWNHCRGRILRSVTREG